jgi:hypothetical protein
VCLGVSASPCTYDIFDINDKDLIGKVTSSYGVVARGLRSFIMEVIRSFLRLCLALSHPPLAEKAVLFFGVSDNGNLPLIRH